MPCHSSCGYGFACGCDSGTGGEFKSIPMAVDVDWDTTMGDGESGAGR